MVRAAQTLARLHIADLCFVTIPSNEFAVAVGYTGQSFDAGSICRCSVRVAKVSELGRKSERSQERGKAKQKRFSLLGGQIIVE